MSTRAKLRSDLRTELKIDPNGKIWSDDVLNWYINSAYFQVQKDGNFDWRENMNGNTVFPTVIGTQEYSLPTDFIRTVLIRFDGTELWKTDKTTLKRELQTFQNGSPSRYYIYWANIWFDVIPDKVRNIDFDYKKRLASLTADIDEIAFSDEFDSVIVKYAAFLAWWSPRGNASTSVQKKQEYDLMLNTLLNAYIFDDVNDLTFTTSRHRFNTGAKVLNR